MENMDKDPMQPLYGNGVFSNVYLSAEQHLEVNLVGTPLP